MASPAKSLIRLLEFSVDERGGAFDHYFGRYEDKLFTLFWIALGTLFVEFLVITSRYVVLVE